jgi:glycosyltransferase involved in cell wall biosynthesis
MSMGVEAVPGADASAAAPIKALYVYCGVDSAQPLWVLDHPAHAGRFAWTRLAVPQQKSTSRVAAGFRAEVDDYDLIVSSEYYVSFGVNLRLRMGRSKARHLVWGLNQSRRAIDLRLTRSLVSWVFNRSDQIIVHSRREAGIFAELHSIPAGKFEFVPWGFDLPEVAWTRNWSQDAEPYVCLIGRNNRDLDTFCQGLEGTGIRGVVISSGLGTADLAALRKWPHIDVYQDLDMSACLDCIRGAMANVVLLKDDRRGAGHITMVAAMLLGKAQIITRAAVVEDYFVADLHALAVPFAAVVPFRTALLRLRDDGQLRSNLEVSARQFAFENFTNEVIARRFMQVAQSAMSMARTDRLPSREKP